MSVDIVKLKVSIDEQDYLPGAHEILRHVRPRWTSPDILHKVFTEGISNKLVGFYIKDNALDIVLIRIYGKKTELMIDRNAEMNTMQLLNAHGSAPPLYCAFENGLCYGFAHGDITTVETIRTPNMCRYVAREMARLHSIRPANLPASPETELFAKLELFMKSAPTDFIEEPVKQSRYEKECPSVDQIWKEIQLLRTVLPKTNCPIVFCHNDALLANIIYNKENETVTFIDYEYAFMNYAGHDWGNHFNEWAGVETVDYSLYPDKETQKFWLREYLSAFNEFAGKQDTPVTENDLEIAYVQASIGSLSSNVFWGIWALIQAKHSEIDFDFLGYAAIRFKRYFDTKDEFLALQK